ncbi:hypothetical protein GCM10011352_23670 [Marinobacterium zhoushanense]|uniref:Uncharacterized protein n=1 Tax=Marinobacterium zhoushanense TaxID=1679163 RepID=A0ABQ1KES5_9GAMM|nr:hypothetical protein [Marinobacterium zhoushanense]GGB96798.1 hypothetical protein GCM10011352_23670 [Marinobacterium zhoushanense]
MIIRVLPELENRDQWLSFLRREQPYCLVEQPECLVDFQTHFLQLTLFSPISNLGQRDPERYTLGSRSSIQPAWDLIRGCNWSLTAIIDGLAQLEFGTNVRDNSLLGLHGDVSVRKRFASERELLPPSASGLFTPLTQLPEQWSGDTLCRLLANEQWRDWQSESADETLSPRALLLALQQSCDSWQVARLGERLLLRHAGRPMVSFIPDSTPPKPRLVDRDL